MRNFRFRNCFILLGALLLFLACAPGALADEILIQQTSYGSSSIVNPPQWADQSFLAPPHAEYVSRVGFRVIPGRYGANWTLQVRADDGTGKPSGTVLGSKSYYWSGMSAGEKEFVLDSPVAVTPGTRYHAVVFTDNASASYKSYIYYASSNRYPNGQMLTSADAGSTWTAQSSYDEYFKISFIGTQPTEFTLPAEGTQFGEGTISLAGTCTANGTGAYKLKNGTTFVKYIDCITNYWSTTADVTPGPYTFNITDLSDSVKDTVNFTVISRTPEILVQQTNNSSSKIITSSWWIDQSFTAPPHAEYLSDAVFKVLPGNNGVAWTLQLRADDGTGKPSGTVLASESRVWSGGDPFGDKNFLMAIPPTLIPGSRYHLVIFNTNTNTTGIYVSKISYGGNPYSGGQMSVSTDGGATWTGYSSNDEYFKLRFIGTQPTEFTSPAEGIQFGEGTISFSGTCTNNGTNNYKLIKNGSFEKYISCVTNYWNTMADVIPGSYAFSIADLSDNVKGTVNFTAISRTPEILVQQTNYNSYRIVSTSFWADQSFTAPPHAEYVSKARFNIGVGYSYSGVTWTLQVRADDPATGKPSGTVLASKSYIWPSGGSGEYEFLFDVPVPVVPGTRYHFVIFSSNSSIYSDYSSIKYAYSPANPYSGGNMLYSADAGVTWESYSSYDEYFKISFVQNILPAVSDAGQYDFPSGDAVAEGMAADADAVDLRATVGDANFDQIRLQAEVRPIGQSFTGNYTHQTDLISSGSVASIAVSGLAKGDYHWQYRVVDSFGEAGDWQEFGTPGNMDFRMFDDPPEVSAPGQYEEAGNPTQIPEGGTAPAHSVNFRSWVSDPDNDQVRMQIELRPAAESFTGSYTHQTDLFSGGVASLTASDLEEGEYHWQARAVDQYGTASDWAEFGTVGNTDFVIINHPPTITIGPGQYRADDSVISEGEMINGNEVKFKATATDMENDQVRLEVEIRPYGQSFTGEGVQQSDLVASGSEAMIDMTLADGQYHWQYRVADEYGNASDWTEFGNLDFIINSTPDVTDPEDSNNHSPNQYKGNSQPMLEKETVGSDQITIKGILSDSSGHQVKLELKLSVCHVFEGWCDDFSSTANYSSDWADSDTQVSISLAGISENFYRWQYRVVDRYGKGTDWKEFGEAGNFDFQYSSGPFVDPYGKWSVNNDMIRYKDSTKYDTPLSDAVAFWNSLEPVNIESNNNDYDLEAIDRNYPQYDWVGHYDYDNHLIELNTVPLDQPPYNSNQAYPIAHEFGHALGLEHNYLGNLMFFAFDPQYQFGYFGYEDHRAYDYLWVYGYGYGQQ